MDWRRKGGCLDEEEEVGIGASLGGGDARGVGAGAGSLRWGVVHLLCRVSISARL